jgi:hypothetical protein
MDPVYKSKICFIKDHEIVVKAVRLLDVAVSQNMFSLSALYISARMPAKRCCINSIVNIKLTAHRRRAIDSAARR